MGPPWPGAGQEAQQTHFPANKIQAQFGLDFVNELSTAWDDLHLTELDRAYERGFLTAFRLWMEVSALGQGV